MSEACQNERQPGGQFTKLPPRSSQGREKIHRVHFGDMQVVKPDELDLGIVVEVQDVRDSLPILDGHVSLIQSLNDVFPVIRELVVDSRLAPLSNREGLGEV